MITKYLLFISLIALAGLMATKAPAATAVWSGSMARDIAATTADGKDAPLVLVARGGGGRGGGGRGGGAAEAVAGAGLVVVLAVAVVIAGVPVVITAVAAVLPEGAPTAEVTTAVPPEVGSTVAVPLAVVLGPAPPGEMSTAETLTAPISTVAGPPTSTAT